MCDRKVGFMAHKSRAPDNLRRIMDATILADRHESKELAAEGVELASAWHAYLHGEYLGTLPFDQARAFLDRVDGLAT